ncbi:rhomboid family intramembrane serine protease [Phaeodactylibacter xiamenensis]|jgi:membrane associated rhomboid family serine protease|uniref:rhomboid family intramembrane serine protease n=1 Tax=Phaeodactylibacter xiamenensis TaxID=1524460 RepID=UPI0024A810D9|nr:rhomboid family intramembrane serine protease [Phaeodactylibacter xiamenensis]
MFRVTEVVKHLLIINVLMYLGSMLLGDPSHGTSIDLVNERLTDFALWGRYRLAMFFPTSDYFRPFQIVTHMFMHADIGHLFFNMFAVFMFGPPLEDVWGPKRFLFYYLLTGFGSVLLHTLVRGVEIYWFGESVFAANVPSLGASGAVFGLLVGYGMLFPDNRIMLLFPPIPLKAKYFVLIYAGVELFMGLGNLNTGVAHYAHLGGALFGFLLILYWRKFGSRL